MAVSIPNQRPDGMLLLSSEHKDGVCYLRYNKNKNATLLAPYQGMSSTDYTKVVQRGRDLLSKIAKSPASTTASPWGAFSSLAAENWEHQHFGNVAPFEQDADTNNPLPDSAPHYHKADFGSKTITWRHKANGGAYYAQYYYPGGAIFATGLRSPLNAPSSEDQRLRGKLPNLHHWSDVTFLQWAELTRYVPHIRRGLKMVVHCGVTNPLTLKIVHEVLGREMGGDMLFPGKSFTPESQEEAFSALLGTPNGMGTGYLLAEHKEELGWMAVMSVQLYTDIS